MRDLLAYGFYPMLTLFATLCLYVIADSLQKMSKNK